MQIDEILRGAQDDKERRFFQSLLMIFAV